MTSVSVAYGDYGNLKTEVIDIPKEDLSTTSSGIKLHSLIAHLKDIGLNIEKSMVLYHSITQGMDVYWGNDPNFSIDEIPFYDIDCKWLKIKWRQPVFTDISDATPKSKNSYKTNRTQDHMREKERKIGTIVEKVREWRSYYEGRQTPSGTVKLNLEEAARLVKMPKKSLDDYLLQMKSGKKYGFNFQAHRDSKVGILRTYVKRHKALERAVAHGLTNDTRLKAEEARSAPGTPCCKGPNCCVPTYLDEFLIA